jgi:FkbM family methyltransferase
MGLIHLARSVRTLVSHSWYHRRTYATPLDAYKGFILRTALGQKGRKLFPMREISIKIEGTDQPIWLRRTTSDFQVFTELFERREYDIVGQLSMPSSPMIFDLGGNIGLGTRRMSMLLPKARFLSVEPDPENRRLFQKNNQPLLDAGRVMLIDGFVSAADGVATIDRSSGNPSGFQMRQAGEQDKEIIQCYTIETLMNKAQAQVVDLLKVDIEGAEAGVFADCARWVGRARHIIIECHLPYTYDQFVADLERAGWKSEVLLKNNAMLCLRRI